MTTIAATDDYVYTVENGDEIYRAITRNPEQKSRFGEPVGDIAQIMTSRNHLYVLRSDGTAARRSHVGDTWAEHDVPVGTTHLSSSDTYIYAIAGLVHRQLDVGGSEFARFPAMDLTGIEQLVHSRTHSYALRSDGIVFISIPGQAWSEYVEPFPDIQQIEAGETYLYIRNSRGQVYRSEHFGFSGWTLNTDSGRVLAMAIETTHRERLWLDRRNVESQTPPTWIGGVRPEYYVVSGYAARNYTITAP